MTKSCFLNKFRKCNLSVIRRKGKSQNVCYKKTKRAKFFKKLTFHTLWYAQVQKFGILCFLVLTVLRFEILTYYRQITLNITRHIRCNVMAALTQQTRNVVTMMVLGRKSIQPIHNVVATLVPQRQN